MKKIILFLFIFTFKCFTQDNELVPPELYFTNNLSKTISVQVHPISMVFNGSKHYNFRSIAPDNNYPVVFCNIAGPYATTTDGGINFTVHHYLILAPGALQVGLRHEIEPLDGSFGGIGFGKYKVTIKEVNTGILIDTFSIEYDFGYPLLGADCSIFINMINGIEKVFFSWSGQSNLKWIGDVNKKLEAWNHYEGGTRPKNYGNFLFDNSDPFSMIPLDSRSDMSIQYNGCSFAFNHGFIDNRSGILTLNLNINKNIFTRDENQMQDFPTYIIITPDVYFKLSQNVVFTMREYSLFSENTRLIVQGTQYLLRGETGLRLLNNSQFVVNNKSYLQFDKNSNVYLDNNSEIRIKPGGVLCNFGARIIGTGKIIIEGISRCNIPQEYIFEDSTKLILEDSSSLILEDSSCIELNGNNSQLILKPNSEIKFGTNSKLILRNGARLIANNATFTYLDSNNKTWDGIYLEDLANDTITNCTIENAVNGLNIINRTNVSINPDYSTQIINCTFKNTTASGTLNYGINLENSDNILIKDCEFIGTVSAKFDKAMNISYCPARNVNIINNDINYCLTGIYSTGSAPYIYGNTFTGSTTGHGIFMDNSAGTVKYNNITGYDKNMYLRYSSPYLYSNSFSNAVSDALELRSSSVPVISPVISETMLYYLGGNNTFTGTPSGSYISFNNDAYPLIEKGINKFSDDAVYYITGAVPTSLQDQTLPAEYNYWTSADPGMFNITEGNIDYEPYNEEPVYPNTEGMDIYSIGFGLYDTVYYDDITNSPIAGDLYIQAYKKEMTGQYTDAVNLYKQLIINYKNKPIAPAALSRIFTVLEKTNTDYSQYEQYFNNLKNNNNNTRQIKELAEDFMIKTKVRRNMLNNAINDYTQIYNQNPNSPKGQHALNNKLVLESMLDTNNNGYSMNPLFVNNTKTTPELFKLYQNYPNPFNPTTTIKYYIPKDGIIEFKVYDIQGREIFYYNGYKQQGEYEYEFDGSNLATGVYFYQLKIGEYVLTNKMVLMK